jgi:hypothetical protein
LEDKPSATDWMIDNRPLMYIHLLKQNLNSIALSSTGCITIRKFKSNRVLENYGNLNFVVNVFTFLLTPSFLTNSFVDFEKRVVRHQLQPKSTYSSLRFGVFSNSSLKESIYYFIPGLHRMTRALFQIPKSMVRP